jgi:hypothetical protein
MIIYILVDTVNNEILTYQNYVLASIDARDREGSKLYRSEISGETLKPATELFVSPIKY